MSSLKIIKKVILSALQKEEFDAQSIFLFGSRARGEEEKLSDYDLLVIVKNEIDTHKKREIRKRIYKELHFALSKISFDIIVKTAEEFELEKEIPNTISNEAFLEGLEI